MSSIPVSTTASLVTPIPDSKIADDCHDGMATPPTAAFNAAKQSLGLPGHSPAQALLVNQSPQLNGQIIDELTGHEGGVLGGRASTFAGAELFDYGSRVTSGTITDLSVGCWIRHTSSTSDGILSEYDHVSGDHRSWLIYTNTSGFVQVLVSEDGKASTKWKLYIFQTATNDGAWHHVFFTFSAGVLSPYLDGKPVTVTKSRDDVITSVFDSTSSLQIGGFGGAGDWAGEIQFPMVWDGTALSAADVVALYNDNTLPSTDPSFLGYLIGDKAYDLTGNQSTITGTATLAEYNDKDVPPAPYELDRAGWTGTKSFDGSTQVGALPTNVKDVLQQGVDFSFRMKYDRPTTRTQYILGVTWNGGRVGLEMNSSQLGFVVYDGTYYKVTCSIGPGIRDVVCSWNTTTKTPTLWVDGVEQVGVGVVNAANTPGGYLASHSAGTGVYGSYNPFLGNIWDFEVWDSVVTPTTAETTSPTYRWNLHGTGSTEADLIAGELITWEGSPPNGYPIPKQIGTGTNVLGDRLTYSGQAKDHGVMSNGPCVETHGAEYGDAGDSADLSFGDGATDSPFSIFARIHIDSFGVKVGGIISKITNTIANTCEWMLVMDNNNKVYLACYDNQTGTKIYTLLDDALSVGTDYEILATYDGSSSETGLTIYVDGVAPDQTRAETGTYVAMHATDAPVEIGVGLRNYVSADYPRYFDGKIWDVRIYDQVVTPAQVDDLSVDPIRHWPLQERTGLTSYDVSGNDNHVTWTSTITRPNAATGYFWNQNKGCDIVPNWDGVDDRITIPNASMTSMTACCWYRSTDAVARKAIYSGIVTANFSISQYLEVVNKVEFHTGAGGWMQGTTPVSTGEWFHIAWTFNEVGNVAKIWVNGLEENSRSGTSNSAIRFQYIGDTWSVGRPLVNTDTSDHQIYDYVLSDAEMLALATSGTIPSVGPVRRYKLDGDIVDSGTDGQDGTLYNGDDTFWDKRLPAKSDNSSLIHGRGVTHPAGPYLIDDGTVIDHLTDETATWLDNLWQGHAEFDGASSFIESKKTFNWNNSWSFECDFYPTVAAVEPLVTSTSNGNYTIQINGSKIRVRANGTLFTGSESYTNNDWNTLKVEYEGGIDGDFVITLNGVSQTITNDASSISQNQRLSFATNNILTTWFTGNMRNIVVSNNGSAWVNMPLSKNCLDVSDNINHGTPTALTFPKLYDGSDLIGAEFVSASNSKVEITNSTMLETDDFDVTARINLDNTGTYKAIFGVSTNSSGSQASGYLIRVDNTNKLNLFFADSTTSFESFQSTATLAADTDYLIRVVKSGTAIEMFIDGSSDSTHVSVASAITYQANSRTLIGMQTQLTDQDIYGMDGKIRDVQLSNGGLLGHWPLLENSTDIINGNDGTDTAVTYSTYNVTDHQYDDAKASPQSQINNSKIISLEN